MGGSLYGWIRGWMGVVNISYLMYDDPALFEEMVSYLADYYMELFAPVLKRVGFDFVYFFEDCCGKNGPLFSPEIYRRILDPYYRKLIRFYKENGVEFALVDSDGDSEKLIPSWLESGFDIMFPIEVGTWKASPSALRKKYGARLNMFGGVDKHVIPLGEAEIRRHLKSLKPAADEGGYIPIPDHRIPPSCSYGDFLTYVRVFNEVFNG
jgi:uroporphyrinogen decarboxylase